MDHTDASTPRNYRGHRRPLRQDTYDWSRDSPVEAVVETLSAVTGVSTSAAAPLQHSVDGDALAALVESGVDSSLTVSFRYDDYSVTVTGSGDVYVFEA